MNKAVVPSSSDSNYFPMVDFGCHWRGLWPASVFVRKLSGIGTGGPKPPPVAPRDIQDLELDDALRQANAPSGYNASRALASRKTM
jgi:hypothetical protein